MGSFDTSFPNVLPPYNFGRSPRGLFVGVVQQSLNQQPNTYSANTNMQWWSVNMLDYKGPGTFLASVTIITAGLRRGISGHISKRRSNCTISYKINWRWDGLLKVYGSISIVSWFPLVNFLLLSHISIQSTATNMSAYNVKGKHAIVTGAGSGE